MVAGEWRVVRLYLVVVAVSTDVNRSRYDGERYEFISSIKGKTSFILRPRRGQRNGVSSRGNKGRGTVSGTFKYIVHYSVSR